MRNSGYNSRISVSGKLLLFFLSGFIAGLVFGCISGRDYADYAGILSEYYMNKYKYMELEEGRLFFYLVRKRLFPVLCLMLLSRTTLAEHANRLYVIWHGFSFGTLFTLLSVCYGAAGIAVGMTGVFPQYLFYVPAMIIIFNSKKVKYGPAEILTVYMIVFVLLAAGIFVETWLNPSLLQGLLKKL